MTFSNDLPISEPEDDRFGLNPFAQSLAASIVGMAAPSGAVLAVNGEWGSGKSSAINLIKHHLKPSIDDGKLVLVPFNPWWFAGADALTLAFFQELSKAIGPSLPDKLRKSIAVMGQGVSAVGAVAGALANLKAPGLGEVISGATGVFGKLAANDTTVEEQHAKISKALQAQTKRFLVVVDDIDRLNPDDALTLFRLVKSVGRLPNVIYLLAFDRKIAERISFALISARRWARPVVPEPRRQAFSSKSSRSTPATSPPIGWRRSRASCSSWLTSSTLIATNSRASAGSAIISSAFTGFSTPSCMIACHRAVSVRRRKLPGEDPARRF